MKLFKLTLVAVALLSFVVACSNYQSNQAVDMRPQTTPTSTAKAPTPAPTPAPDELAGAAADYTSFCVRCHKADGTGGPFKIDEENKTIKVPNLRENGKRDP